jgi:ribulose-phosphate 3-epimerase
MPPRILIAPSVLSADFGRLADEVRAAEKAGADVIHLDVMDGHFVPNITIGPMVVAAVNKVTDLPLDVHLMIEHPERYVDQFAKAGADVISVHPEACPHLHRVIQQIRAAGARPSCSLNPHTPLNVLDHVLEDLAMVLIMTVNPGFGGQSFIEACVPKVKALREEANRRGLALDIEVDGGIKPGPTIRKAAEAGANVFVAGSAVFEAPDYAAVIRALRDGAREAWGLASASALA